MAEKQERRRSPAIGARSKGRQDINARIIDINAEESERYIADDERRRIYVAQHPTQVVCFKCMDGRVHMPTMTDTPRGIINPYRAIGGKFRVFWPGLRKRLRLWIERGLDAGKRSLAFVTYHHSASDTHLGCAGWNYDTDAARAHAEALCVQLSKVYGYGLTPIPTRVETDGDLITLHGERDVSGQDLFGLTDDQARAKLAAAFPTMEERLVEDVLPFMLGNARRVAHLRKQPRDLSGIDHSERVIALGQGFDWLALQNFALIINDIDPNLDFAIETAAKIVKKNLEGPTDGDFATLFTNIPFRRPGMEQREAEVAALELQEFAQHVIRERHPDLWSSGKLHFLVGITFEPNKKLTVLEQGVVGA